MADIVQLDLGVSTFEAEVIAQSLKAEGLLVELLRNEYPETGGSMALGNCILLVRAEDEARVRAHISSAGY